MTLWPKIPFGEAFTVVSDRGHRVPLKQYLSAGPVPVVDQGAGLVGGFTRDLTMLVEGPLPLLVFGDHTRRVKYVDFPFAVGAQGVKLLRANDGLDSKFAYWFLTSHELSARGYGRHFALLRQVAVPLPPIAEQLRVVELLEDHLSRLDAAEYGLTTVRRRSGAFDRSLLGNRFSPNGLLAARSACDDPSRIEVMKLEDCLELLVDHRGKTAEKLGGSFVSSGVRVISAIHIKDRRVKFDERERFVTDELYRKWMKEPLAPGDVLLTSEAPLGEVALAPDDGPLVLSQRLFALRGKHGLLSNRYLFTYLQSPQAIEQLTRRSSGTTVTGIRQSELRKVEIPVPGLKTQSVLVSAIDEHRSRVERAKQSASLLSVRVRALRSALLRAAFSGQLSGVTHRTEIEELADV
jgi:restriction endonuclease S subunit